jgi:hypothetical protein
LPEGGRIILNPCVPIMHIGLPRQHNSL